MISDPNDSLDPYAVLGIQRDAGAERVRKAYRRAAFQSHPDRNPGRETEARKTFERVQEAYRVLSDPLERAAWDRRHPSAATRPPGQNGGGPRKNGAASTGRDDGRRARRPDPDDREPPADARRRKGSALRPRSADGSGRATVVSPRGLLVAIALAAAAVFAFAAKFVGFLLLAVGGRAYAPAPQRALYDRWWDRIPAPLRPLPTIGRALLALGVVAIFSAARLSRPEWFVAAAEAYGPATLAAGLAVVLIERAAFGLFWVLHAERAGSVRGG